VRFEAPLRAGVTATRPAGLNTVAISKRVITLLQHILALILALFFDNAAGEPGGEIVGSINIVACASRKGSSGKNQASQGIV
jgi:hypothetical protein